MSLKFNTLKAILESQNFLIEQIDLVEQGNRYLIKICRFNTPEKSCKFKNQQYLIDFLNKNGVRTVPLFISDMQKKFLVKYFSGEYNITKHPKGYYIVDKKNLTDINKINRNLINSMLKKMLFIENSGFVRPNPRFLSELKEIALLHASNSLTKV